MKVKIIKSSHWHKGMIGHIVNTSEPDRHGDVIVREPGATYHGNGLWKGDYEVVTGNTITQPMKFRVQDAAHSERIQRAVFAAGGLWASGDTDIRYTSDTYLYVDAHDKAMTRGSSAAYFDSNSRKEHYLDSDGKFTTAAPLPATKFTTIEDVKYEVPGWAKFVTRDHKDRNVWAWESKPEWKGNLRGYYKSGNGKAELVKPYVEPKPEGHFIVEVA